MDPRTNAMDGRTKSLIGLIYATKKTPDSEANRRPMGEKKEQVTHSHIVELLAMRSENSRKRDKQEEIERKVLTWLEAKVTS